jgi:hypothetical protein
MTELSPASLRSIRWTVTLAASLGWFFDAYVITIYALTVPLLAAEFHLATNILSGAIGSIFLFGYTIGTIGFGVSGDRFGRRVMLGVSVVGYGVVTALTALASGIGSLAAFRFLTGLGGGDELSIGSPYVTEVCCSTVSSIIGCAGPRSCIFQTGVGTRALFAATDSLGLTDLLLRLLDAAQVVVRGPKPATVLHSRKVRIDRAASNPFTTHEVLAEMHGTPLRGNASWCSVTARPIVSCRYSDSLDPAPQLKIHHSRNANASGPCKPHLRHFQQGARGTALFQRDFHDAALENAGSPQKSGHRAHDAMVRACAGWRRI